MQLTIEQARAICDGLERQRKERNADKIKSLIRSKNANHDDSLKHKDDYVLYSKTDIVD